MHYGLDRTAPVLVPAVDLSNLLLNSWHIRWPDHYPTFGRLGLGAGPQADERAQDTREDYVRNLRIVGDITRSASIPMWLYFNIIPCKLSLVAKRCVVCL